jgi:BirA family biotin operon repressor/biotin-[acetyl-CoA-carboxylase] ligase
VPDDTKRPGLDLDELRRGIDALWTRVDIVDETGSTNADLITRAGAGEDIAGAVLLAEYQNSGRGRHGRQWTAPPRSQLSMSVGVAVAGIPTEAWGWLPLATGVAVVDAIDQVCGVEAGLKWPNDVLVQDRKLAGILAEVAAPAPAVVVGIGLNVTMTADEAPDPRATSLLLLDRAVDRNVLAAAVLEQLAVRVTRWRAAGGADPELVADYRSRSVTLGTRVRATLPGDRAVEGVAVAVDELGRLRIDTGDATETVSAGDITHLRPVEP